jgi:hypothetical protein
MHLINPLVAGIRGAEVGSVELLERGTSTHAVYYKDFPATQQYSVQPIPLDSFGSVTLYVEELVDVLVHDSNGVLVRQFVAGDYAAAVEVISQSFTGTDYRDGTKGPFKPTNLASVLDLWKTNSGATDWKVLVGNLPLSISDALSSFAGLYYNVKSFGAIGNGIADDSTGVQAAVNAAAVAGGTVFFPPGVYRTTVSITVPVNVCILGSGAPASKLAVSANVWCIVWTGAESGGMRTVRGMWFGSMTVMVTTFLTQVSGNGPRVLFEDCLFGNDTTTQGRNLHLTHFGSDAHVIVNRCSFYNLSDDTILSALNDGRLTIRDSDFKDLYYANKTFPCILVQGGTVIENCRFDASAVPSGTMSYISYGPPGTWGTCKFVNNWFKKGPAVVAGIRGSGSAIWESGNSFGDPPSGFLPLYVDTLADGWADVVMDTVGLRTRGSRVSRCFGVANDSASVQIDAKNYALAVIKRTVGGAQTVTATLGTLGDELRLLVLNNTGAPLTFTVSTGFSAPGGGGSGTIPVGGKGLYEFAFMPLNTGTTGAWMLTAQVLI